MRAICVWKRLPWPYDRNSKLECTVMRAGRKARDRRKAARVLKRHQPRLDRSGLPWAIYVFKR